MKNQQIKGDGNLQAGRDINVFAIKNELSSATQPIRDTLVDEHDLFENDDDKDTVLISKLTNGGFNVLFRNNATRKKLDALNIIIDYSKKQTGKEILNDIYENLLTVINLKYISQLEDGESLKSSTNAILEELSAITDKYKDQLNIDEAFLEGLLYIATSRCALKWRMEDSDGSINDRQSN